MKVANDQYFAEDGTVFDQIDPNAVQVPPAQPKAAPPQQQPSPQASPTTEDALRAAGSVAPAMLPARPGGQQVLVAAGGVAPSQGSVAPFVLAGAGAVAGGMYAGLWGAAAGALAVGAVVNANRWRLSAPGPTKSQHGIFALATLGAAVYAGWKAYERKQNSEPEEEDETPAKEPDVVEVAANAKRPTKPVPRPWLKPKRMVKR